MAERHSTNPGSPNFLLVSGEMAERVRGFDWAATPLGAPGNWAGPLRRARLRALSASSAMCHGPRALRLLQGKGRIDLLITDVGPPGGLNGRQIADAARLHRSDLKVLFITGYAENEVVGNGHLESGMEVITKPFVLTALAAKIREMIE